MCSNGMVRSPSTGVNVASMTQDGSNGNTSIVSKPRIAGEAASQSRMPRSGSPVSRLLRSSSVAVTVAGCPARASSAVVSSPSGSQRV